MCMSGQDRAVEREMQDILGDFERFQQAKVAAPQHYWEIWERCCYDIAVGRDVAENNSRLKDLAKVMAYRAAAENIERVTR